jgi:hypothetical protein
MVHAPERATPATRWAFGDVNPPVTLGGDARLSDRAEGDRQGDTVSRARLSQIAHQLHLVVNRKDADGRNVFQGGFLGLDNIGVFNRASSFPAGRA